MTTFCMRAIARAAAVVMTLGLAGLPAPLAAQQISDVTPAEMLQAAKLSLQGGDLARAIAYADALLLRDPSDTTAHLIRSAALRDAQEFEAAQLAAREGWRRAETDAEKHSAALLMAQALSSDGKRTRAQLWLRRAVEHAPSPAHAQRARQDFRYVQRRNPWQTYLSFTLAPNSNINNGSARDSYLSNSIFDQLLGGGPQLRPINAEAQAISGLEYGVRLQSRYRFAQTERRAHDLTFGLSYRSYVLGSSAKRDLPDAKGSDYAFGTASIGYGFKQLRADRRGELDLGLELGQLFYAGSRYSSYLRASAAQSYYLSPRNKLRYGLTAETENGQRVSDSESLSLSVSLDRALERGDGLTFGIDLTGQRSPNILHEYNEIRLRGGYIFGREIMGAAVQVSLGARWRDYDAHLLSIDGRRDLEISADFSATFRQIDYYGFNPRVTLSASRTDSTIGVYDSNRLGLGIGIASSF